MIPFVPMIPGTVQDSASGVLSPVLLVGVDNAAELVSVIMVETGVINHYSSWLVKADAKWIKHYLETVA
jgi:hypothetical protein